MKKGFTIIEFLIVAFIIGVLLAFSFFSFNALRSKSEFNNTIEAVINTLRVARSRTVSSEGASSYGVYFDNTVSPQKYILFKGASYSSRDPSYDNAQEIPKDLAFLTINLGGGKEIVFDRLNGASQQQGYIEVGQPLATAERKKIYIDSSGRVDLTAGTSPGLTDLIRDSRHTHFNLGWNIQDASILKFYFPADSQTATADMSVYFNADKTNFDWQGSFDVGGQEQKFRIHTHSIDPFNFPFTKLSITRDRNNGKNTRDVWVYIIDSGVDKTIAHYFIDGHVEKGQDVDSMEIQ